MFKGTEFQRRKIMRELKSKDRGIVGVFCKDYEMRQMEKKFNEETCIRTFGFMTGHRELQEMPHPDTLNWYLEQVSLEDIAKVRRNMIKKIIRMNSSSRGKLNGVYWKVVLDGTGLFYFKEKHCENCLITTIKKEDGKTEKRYEHETNSI